MLLDDRKRRILKVIIDDYISTAEPVGSRTVARKNEIGLSSATIRNEMSDLEEMGLLEQPHTSAGRVPSDKGYRIYVDQLMVARELPADEIESIREALKFRLNELGQLIKQVSAVISDITKYTSMAMTPQMNKSTLKSLQLILVEQDRLLVIIVTNAGIVKNSLVKILTNVTTDTLLIITNFFDDKLQGVALEKVDIEKLKNETEKIFKDYKETILPIIDGIKDCITQIFYSEIFLDGATKMFNFPEFQDMLRAKQFLSILDTREILGTLMFNGIENQEGIVKVRIGVENEIDELKDFSLITATYSMHNSIIGSFGVIGPTRMHYPKVIASLNYISRVINKELSNEIKKEIGLKGE